MTIGERKIRGIMREKEEAEQHLRGGARARAIARLLMQERPNIFTQKVANIEPGKRIDVNIRYFHTLAYEDGWYEFVFPMVRRPAVQPAGFEGARRGVAARGLSAGRRPERPCAICARASARPRHRHRRRPRRRRGDRGARRRATRSRRARRAKRARTSTLAAGDTIPNKDFVLRYRVAGDAIKSTSLTYTDARPQQGYFTLMLYPPVGPTGAAAPARSRWCSSLDTSGSMNGQPLEQARRGDRHALDRLERGDTFQIMKFSQRRAASRPAACARRRRTSSGRALRRRLGGDGGTRC